MLYQLSYEDPYIGSRPIYWVHLNPWQEYGFESRWSPKMFFFFGLKIRNGLNCDYNCDDQIFISAVYNVVPPPNVTARKLINNFLFTTDLILIHGPQHKTPIKTYSEILWLFWVNWKWRIQQRKNSAEKHDAIREKRRKWHEVRCGFRCRRHRLLVFAIRRGREKAEKVPTLRPDWQRQRNCSMTFQMQQVDI